MAKSNVKQCASCKKNKNLREYYSTSSAMYPDGKLSLCKNCIRDMIDPDDVGSLKSVLRQVDKPYLDSVWKTCLKDSPENPTGNYWRVISSLPQYSGLTWVNSSFGEGDNAEPIKPYSKLPVSMPELDEDDEDVDRRESNASKSTGKKINTSDVPIELFDKWGYEFKPEEIMAFENLYNELKNNYKLTTASHIEFLKLACISRVKAVNAMARGDTKDARDYMAMFKDTTSAGKLQPAQFSKSDLSEGLDTFSELVRQVEKTVDIIPVLPRFKERPQDKVDIVIWCYANYVRNLKGLEEASYDEIWKFYDVRKKDYENATASTSEREDEDG